MNTGVKYSYCKSQFKQQIIIFQSYKLHQLEEYFKMHKVLCLFLSVAYTLTQKLQNINKNNRNYAQSPAFDLYTASICLENVAQRGAFCQRGTVYYTMSVTSRGCCLCVNLHTPPKLIIYLANYDPISIYNSIGGKKGTTHFAKEPHIL